MEDTEEYNLEINPDQLCVACLSQDNALKNLFTVEIVDGRILPLQKIYEELTSVKVNHFVFR